MKSIPYDIKMPYRRGQSLLEILVAVAIGAIMFTAAAGLIVPALRSTSQIEQTQTASAMGKELLENVRVFAEANWHNIDGLATTPAHTYYLNTTSSPFVAALGTQSIGLSTTTYTRNFYVNDVFRNGSGQIDPNGATPDPSVKKITVVYGWSTASRGSSTISMYLTRSQDFVFDQTDWSGGANFNGTFSTNTNQYATATLNITTTGTIGSIMLAF